jgi:UPF0755 protein
MLEGASRRSARRQRVRRSHKGAVFLVVVGLLMFGGAAAAFGTYNYLTGANGTQTPVTITIPHGSTGDQIAQLLQAKGVIRSTLGFRLYLKVKHPPTAFLAGTYHMTTNMTVPDALAALTGGPLVAKGTPVTFPEGRTIQQIADVAHQKLGVSAAALVKIAHSGRYSLAPYLPAGTKNAEGFLFPSTYDFKKGTTPDQVVQRLITQFGTSVKSLPWGNAHKLGVTPYQVVVIASMIEREALFDADRPKVAAVVYNRLKKGMALQIDATVIYALGGKKPDTGLTYTDLKVNSPYNTYIHTGLPPTPIDSPSFKSIQAALNPISADYLYYVGDITGHECFTSNYNEFVRLKHKFAGESSPPPSGTNICA